GLGARTEIAIEPVEQERVADPHGPRDHMHPARDEIQQLEDGAAHALLMRCSCVVDRAATRAILLQHRSRLGALDVARDGNASRPTISAPNGPPVPRSTFARARPIATRMRSSSVRNARSQSTKPFNHSGYSITTRGSRVTDERDYSSTTRLSGTGSTASFMTR